MQHKSNCESHQNIPLYLDQMNPQLKFLLGGLSNVSWHRRKCRKTQETSSIEVKSSIFTSFTYLIKHIATVPPRALEDSNTKEGSRKWTFLSFMGNPLLMPNNILGIFQYYLSHIKLLLVHWKLYPISETHFFRPTFASLCISTSPAPYPNNT